NFAKNDAAIRALQLGKNRLKEIGHEESASRRERGRRRVVTPGELQQILAQWRQIPFQGKYAGTQRKFWIGAPDNIFKERAHAGHHFQIADHRLADAFADGIRFRDQRLHSLEKFVLQIGVIDGKQEMLVSAL